MLGTDDPTEVQSCLSDWDKFNDVAAKAAAKGYKMLSGFDDAYRTFSNNVSAPWVSGTTVTVDPNLMKWVDQTKEYTDKGYNNKSSLWDSQWASDQGAPPVRCSASSCTCGHQFTLLGNSLWQRLPPRVAREEVGNGIYGRLRCVRRPSALLLGRNRSAAASSDNLETIKDVMLKLTCDEAVMKADHHGYAGLPPTTRRAMNEIANSDFQVRLLGGRTTSRCLQRLRPRSIASNAGPYDQGLPNELQTAFRGITSPA